MTRGITKDIRMIIVYAVPISLWPSLGTLTLMTVGNNRLKARLMGTLGPWCPYSVGRSVEAKYM